MKSRIKGVISLQIFLKQSLYSLFSHTPVFQLPSHRTLSLTTPATEPQTQRLQYYPPIPEAPSRLEILQTISYFLYQQTALQLRVKDMTALLRDAIMTVFVNPAKTAATALLTVPEFKTEGRQTGIAVVTVPRNWQKEADQFVMGIFKKF